LELLQLLSIITSWSRILSKQFANRSNCFGLRFFIWIVYLLKSEPLVWSFWGEPSRVANFWKECWETGWLLLKLISFAFSLGILIVSPIPAEKVTQWLGGDSWWTIPVSPTIVIPAYLKDYAAIPLVAGLIEKRNGTGNRDGFHGNRRSNF
jgi:uncharacterized membrane protein YraQ (UPF0718 family)